MSNTAYQIQYRQEFVKGFERTQTMLRDSVTTEVEIKGQQAVFLVADSGGAQAVTRGANGLIPARDDNLNQVTTILQEWHDLPRKTRFNIFASQGDQRKIMQYTSLSVVHRKIDDDIIAALTTATHTTGGAIRASLDLVVYAKTILGNLFVPLDNQIYAAISPAFHGYLMQTTEFTSALYVNDKPFEKPGEGSEQKMVAFRWAGVNFVVHTGLAGLGTNNETCFMWHRNSVGHAVDKEGINTPVGYNEEQDYSWARASIFMGSAVLQNNGIVVIPHDGSRYAYV